MPQMSPMDWLMLSIYFLFIYLIMLIVINFMNFENLNNNDLKLNFNNYMIFW